jgi:hypothetical protein
LQWIAIVRQKPSPNHRTHLGNGYGDLPQPRAQVLSSALVPAYMAVMIRIAVSLAAYQALASTLAQGSEAHPPEPLEVGEGVGMWIDHATLAALKGERRVGEGWSEVILRLVEAH